MTLNSFGLLMNLAGGALVALADVKTTQALTMSIAALETNIEEIAGLLHGVRKTTYLITGVHKHRQSVAKWWGRVKSFGWLVLVGGYLLQLI